MKNYDLDILKDAAHRLMFSMSEDEFEVLLKEFDTVVVQMKLLDKNNDLQNYSPMVFPFECSNDVLREDIPCEPLAKEDAIKNAGNVSEGQIKLPKVVQ